MIPPARLVNKNDDFVFKKRRLYAKKMSILQYKGRLILPLDR